MNGCCCKIFVILPLLLSVAITAFASTDKENKSEIEKSYKKLVEERITWGLLKINFVPKKFETRNNGINVSLLSVCVFQGPRGNQRLCLPENVTKRILLSAFFFSCSTKPNFIDASEAIQVEEWLGWRASTRAASRWGQGSSVLLTILPYPQGRSRGFSP